MKIARLIVILKEANLYSCLLNDFENSLVADRTFAYKTAGSSTNITPKQEVVFEEIAYKLGIPGSKCETY